MKSHGVILFLAALFLLVAALVVYWVVRGLPDSSAPARAVQKTEKANAGSSLTNSSVLWRVPVSSTANTPLPLPCGWLVTDSNGQLHSFTGNGKIRWQASYSNCAWCASTLINEDALCIMTKNGQLFLFDAETGTLKWSQQTGLSCLHPPLVAMIGKDTVLVLLSQEDGTLLCLNAYDGTTRWRSPSTSRTDGPAVSFDQMIAYGNCDAAVHLFSLTDGHLKGSIQLNDDEQIAGTLLPLGNDRLVVGTRSGSLVLLDTARMTCLSRKKLSDSEAFSTPVQMENDRVFIPTAEGQMTFWKIVHDALVPDGVIPLSSQFDETIVGNSVFWAIANHTLFAVRLANPAEQLRYRPGDDLRGVSPGCFGKTALISDGELICVKGF